MEMKNIWQANTKLHTKVKDVTGEIVTLDNERYYKIANYDQIPDFFIAVVSDSDLWMYISSNGSLTAGRKDRDNALFPYYTEDKIHDSKDKTGSKTSCLVHKKNKIFLWEPFAYDQDKIYNLERNLYRNIFGNKIIFEEINRDLDVTFRYGWYSSEKYGWIKKSELETGSPTGIKIKILDGISNILPYGVDYAFQNEYSNLLIAYRKNELLSESKLALLTLSSIPVDKAEPSEALKATVVWSAGIPQNSDYLISDKQIENFRRGANINSETDIFAARGGYFAVNEYDLDKSQPLRWYFVADVNKDSTGVIDLDLLLKKSSLGVRELEEDINAGTLNLVRIVASADGLQLSNDKLNDARHFTNTLYNVMRGGVFDNNYIISAGDFRLFVQQCNKHTGEKFSQYLADLPDSVLHDRLIAKLTETEDPDLERIGREYLPLAFSRRHGDPSRPWNRFSIDHRKKDGTRKLSYQGNWRDIFQNWEALCISYPQYVESVITRFVNASTADGYNPYRITREGIDWERPHHDDPWAYIGYWGDHQVIYLQKFLEQSCSYNPGKLEQLLEREIFVYANVPYRIRSFSEVVSNPGDTITFDRELDSKIEFLSRSLGSDASLLRGPGGNICRANLLEKILCSLLAKLVNFIPGAGIWLNTQRPEWNDANNALVGNGVSVVTLCYLRRSLLFWIKLLEKSDIKEYKISDEIVKLFETVFFIFRENNNLLETGLTDCERHDFTLRLGKAGDEYRQKIYSHSFSGMKSGVSRGHIVDFMKLALVYADSTIEQNRRDDGLFHSYNLISFKENSIKIRRLYLMLEGQVALLSSGILDSQASLRLLDSLRSSKLYRYDQQSYMLYPMRQLPRFTEKNNLTRPQISGSAVLRKMIAEKDFSIVSEDSNGDFHFSGEFRNSSLLSHALESLDEKKYGRISEDQKEYILNLYETVFDHQSFTGRSGTFYGYEGIGSIYWHMVSKLLLAVCETFQTADKENADKTILSELLDHYYSVKEGLGIHKSPAVHGAIPIDAYSHTPAGEGARQPGLTGQVKEDIISRFGELGVIIRNGTIAFSASMLKPDEFLKEEEIFRYYDTEGKEFTIKLQAGQLAFTICQVPVIVRSGNEQQMKIFYNNSRETTIKGFVLDGETCKKIFGRTCEIVKIEFFTGIQHNK